MGLFDKLKGKGATVTKIMETEKGAIYAPITGNYISQAEIPDKVFSQGILGPGCGIEPAEGEVVAPVNGIISIVADTKHAIGITSEEGAEILIHVGMDTVEMNGDGFKVLVKADQKVVCGQSLLKFDIGKIKKAGHPITTAFVLTNADEYADFSLDIDRYAKAMDKIGKLN